MIFVVVGSGAWSFGAAEREQDAPSTRRSEAIVNSVFFKVSILIGPSIRAAETTPQGFPAARCLGRPALTAVAATVITHGRRHPIEDVNVVLRALEYAADRHRNQRRKDLSQTPYINHLIAVADLIANVGGVSDSPVIAAALLHDVVEDAGVTNAEVAERFGADVAGLVAEVTDDKALDKQERKRRQVEHAPGLTPRAKLLKLADKIANVTDVIERPPATWSRRRCAEYLAWSAEVVAGCRGTNPGLERRFDAVLEQGRARYPDRR
jgi:hypothetical protein